MKKFIIAALAISFGLTTFAQEAITQTATKHPRVHQVNKRIVNQERRIYFPISLLFLFNSLFNSF